MDPIERPTDLTERTEAVGKVTGVDIEGQQVTKPGAKSVCSKGLVAQRPRMSATSSAGSCPSR